MSAIDITNSKNGVLSLVEKRLGEIPAIRAIREECYALLLKSGLPETRNEEYRNTPLSKALEKFDFSVPSASPAPSERVEGFGVPGLDAYALVFVNGKLDLESSTATRAPGLSIRPLRDALEAPGAAEQYFARIADPKHDPFVTWNTMAWDNGVFIEVEDHTSLEKPLAIYHVNGASERQGFSFLRNLIVVGKESKLTLIQKFNATGDHAHFTNIVNEVVVREHASLTAYTLQDDSGDRYHFNHTQIYQHHSSKVNAFVFTLDGKMIRNNLQLDIDGEGCESHMYGLYLIKGDTLADNHTVANHLKPNSLSNELYKGILDDRAKGVFNGKIYVRPNAQKTNAFQSNRNLLLTDQAKVNTKPQLEIWADDVKCSHGCTTGQLDEEALFYLRARGIPKSMAQGMLLYAFAGEVINAIAGVPELRSYLERTVSKRLHQT